MSAPVPEPDVDPNAGSRHRPHGRITPEPDAILPGSVIHVHRNLGSPSSIAQASFSIHVPEIDSAGVRVVRVQKSSKEEQETNKTATTPKHHADPDLSIRPPERTTTTAHLATGATSIGEEDEDAIIAAEEAGDAPAEMPVNLDLAGAEMMLVGEDGRFRALKEIGGDQEIANDKAQFGQKAAPLFNSLLKLPDGNQVFGLRRTQSRVGQDIRDLKIKEFVAEGAFGALHKGIWMGGPVAVKSLKKVKEMDPGAMREFTKEAAMLSRLRHPNIMFFMGAVRTLDAYLLITEWLPGGTLHKAIHANKNFTRLSEREAIKFAIDIASALQYLHNEFDPKIIHRDLKPHNLIVSKEGDLKIADFGLSRFLSDGDMTGATGSWRWMAPEVAQNKRYSEKCDIYSLGMIMWQMCATEQPFSSQTELQAAILATQGMRPHRPPRISDDLYKLIIDCWAEDPGTRPSADAILSRLEAMANSRGHAMKRKMSMGATAAAAAKASLAKADGRARGDGGFFSCCSVTASATMP